VKRSRLLLVGAVPIVAALLLSSCSSDDSGTSNAGTDDLIVNTPAATSEVDSVTWNLYSGEPSTVDPFHSADYSPNTVTSNMCENLLVQTPDYKIAPNLASSFDNPDPTTWVYNLRSDVKFWDGTPMTADDVAFSLQNNLNDPGTYYHNFWVNVASVDVTGDSQVTVKLKTPDYFFNAEMASFAGVVVQKKFFQEHAKDFGTPSVGVMCTGPFKFESWSKGQSVTVARNDNYWNAEMKPMVKSIKFTFLVDESTITQALQSGEIDGTYKVPLSGLAQLKSSSAGKVYMGPSEQSLAMMFTNPQGALANKDVRKALQMAIDWDGIAKTILKGTGTPSKTVAPQSVFGASRSILQKSYDAMPAVKSADYDGAKALVASAGADAKKSILMVTSDNSTYQAFGNAVVDAGNRIGLTMKLKVVPSAQFGFYFFDPKTRAGVDILAVDYWPNIAETGDWYGLTAASTGPGNRYGYDGIDDLYTKAQGTADLTARSEVLAQIQEKLAEDVIPMTPGIEEKNTLWMNKRITGAPASFNYMYYPWAALLGGSS